MIFHHFGCHDNGLKNFLSTFQTIFYCVKSMYTMLFPVWEDSPKIKVGARTIRSKINNQLKESFGISFYNQASKHRVISTIEKIEKMEKTKLCENYEKGKCTKGELCKYAHGKDNLQIPIYSDLYKTKHCTKFINQGFCILGEGCFNIHGGSSEKIAEMRASVELVKNKSVKKKKKSGFDNYVRQVVDEPDESEEDLNLENNNNMEKEKK